MRAFKKKTLLGLTLIKEETGQKSTNKNQVLTDETKKESNTVLLQNDNKKNSTKIVSLDDEKSLNCQQSNTSLNVDIDEEVIIEVASILQAMGDMMELTMALKRNLYLENDRSRFFDGGNSSTQ